MSPTKKKIKRSPLENLEISHVHELSTIAKNLDSPNMEIMYTATNSLATLGYVRGLLPKAMSLLSAQDMFIRKSVFRLAGQNAFGEYICELTRALVSMKNPGETEQVLHAIHERFMTFGSLISTTEQKEWVSSLDDLGNEHQSTIVGIMTFLGKPGIKWVTDLVKKDFDNLALGSIPMISAFPKSTSKKLLKAICKNASQLNNEKRRCEILESIAGVLDTKTVRLLSVFLQSSSWQERVIVARTVGSIGISSSDGLIMDILADPDWRVKQELLENINVSSSKFSSIMRVLQYVITDSHTRVRGLAERVLLRLGAEVCINSDIDTQRKKIEKEYRTQLLRSASKNKDIDSSWLGVSVHDPIPVIDESTEDPVGVSLDDIETEDETSDRPEDAKHSDLLSALLSAKKDVEVETNDSDSMISQLTRDTHSDTDLSPAETFIQKLKQLMTDDDKGVPLKTLRKEFEELGYDESVFDTVLSSLEAEGTVYRPKKDTIRYVDMDL